MDANQRISDLEAILSEYIAQNTLAQRRFEAESKQFREEMLAFKEEIRRDTQALKDEMRAFKDEIRRDTQALKDEMRAFKDEIRRDTQALKDEMRAFKDEMNAFKDRVELNIKENNKQWGALANKLGTIVEDLIFPASRPVIESVFGVTLQHLSMRVVRRNADLKEEFDVVAYSEKQVFLIEVKSTPRFDYLSDFVDRKIDIFRQLFPEYASLTLVPIFASISVPDDFVQAATNRRVFVMAYREWEYMDILNAKELLSQF
jgi:gas vesicle protein